MQTASSAPPPLIGLPVFAKLWRGEYSLAQSFWSFLVLGSFAAVILSGLVLYVFDILGRRSAGVGVRWLLFGVYEFICCVGVWRSADALVASGSWSDYRSWGGFLAKLALLFWVPALILRATGLKFIDVLQYLLGK